MAHRRHLIPICAVLLLVLSWTTPGRAECNPSYDPLCGETPLAGPDAGIQPDGGTFVVDETSVTIPVTVVFTDPDGVNASTLQIRLWKDGSSAPVNLVTTSDPYRLTAKGNLSLSGAGEHVLVAQIADSFGNVGSARATYTITLSEPGLPIVLADTHHNEFRNTAAGAFVMPFRIGSYTSAGVTRTIALVYNSEHARPSMVLHADARPDPRNGLDVVAMSLRIENAATGALIREQFYKKSSMTQRLSWRTDTNSRTGAYKYAAAVRSHFADGTYKETRRIVRGLLVNEQSSRYGAGWSVAGVQRIHASSAWSDGVVLNEGNGVVRFFAKGACAGDCAYVTPAGDFSRLEYRASTATYVRTYPDGSTITFSNRGLMTHGADRFGNTTTIEWQDTQDATPEPVLRRIVDPLGHAVTFAYNAEWYLQSIAVAGRTMTCTYNASKELVRVDGPYSLEATYGTGTHLLASFNIRYGATDPGAVWDVAYDRHRRPSALTAPAVEVDGVLVRPRTQFRSVEAATIVPAGTGTSVGTAAPAVDAAALHHEIQDPGGHYTRMNFDRYGNPLKTVNDAGSVTVTWNSDGLPATSTGEGDSSFWVWSSRGELLQHSVSGTVVYEASYDNGLKLYERAGGTTTWFGYGPRGELIRSWTGNSDDRERTATTYEYNPRYELVRATEPNNRRTEWSYDGNPWRSADFVRVTNVDGTVATTRYTYDEWSRLRTIVNAKGEVTDRAYDDADRIIRVSDPLWRMTSYVFTGAHLTRVTDAAGKSFDYTYNAVGWLVAERRAGSPCTRTYRYDVDGQVRAVTDCRGKTVTYTYDSAHRRHDLTADGVTTTFRYPDPYHTVVTNPESTITTRIIPGVGSLDYVRATLGARRYDIQRFYEPNGMWRDTGFDLKTYVGDTLQSTESVRYTRDVSRHSLQDFTGRTSSIEYDGSGRPASIHFANGATQTNVFNDHGRVTATSFNTAANARLGATFSYDILNRLSGRATPSGNRFWEYSYDSPGQVSSYSVANSIPVDCDPTIQDCSPGTGPRRNEQYTYDAAGNRTDRGASLVSGGNRYSAFDGYTLDYDADGNLIRKSRLGHDQRFTWNSLGQLTSVMTNGVTVSYGYDGLGRRVRRSEAGVTRYFLYDGDDLLLETDANGAVLRTYAHWPGTDRPLGVRIGSGAQAPMYYYTLESPGHVSGLLDPAGGTAAEHHYTPFGEVESADDPTGQPLRFMGRELDFGSGLYYVRNRWYDPVLARFISEDPIGIAGGINTYAYAGNDPLNQRDPSGLGPDPCDTYWWAYMCQEGYTVRLEPLVITVNADGDEEPLVTTSILLPGRMQKPPEPLCSPALCPNQYPTEMSYLNPNTIGPRYEPVYDVRVDQCRALRNLAANWTFFDLIGSLGAPQVSARPMRVPRSSPSQRTIYGVPPVAMRSGGFSGESWRMYYEAGCGR